MNISNQLKGYGFSYFEETLWREAEEMVYPRFKRNKYNDKKYSSNWYKGSKWEIFITLIFEHLISVMGLENVMRVNSNPTDHRYITAEGQGLDHTISIKKPSGLWITALYIEAKNWNPRYMSPKVFLTHVKQRFWNVCQGTKILITRGVKYGIPTLNQLVNNGYKLVTTDYVNSIRELIVTNIKKYNIITRNYKPITTTSIKSVTLHKHRTPPYCKDPISEHIKNQTYKNNTLTGG